MSKETNKNKIQVSCSNLPRPVSLQDAENPDAVWKTIIKRFPNTAPLLCEMEEVIDRAQSILSTFKSVSCLAEKEPLRIPNATKKPDSIKRYGHTNANIQEFIINKSDHKIPENCSHETVSLKEWEEFGHNKGIDHLSYSSYFNDATPMAMSPLSINNSSTNTTNFDYEIKSTDSLKKMEALYEIEKVQSLSFNDPLETYKNSISMTKYAIETVKSTEMSQKQTMDKNDNASHIITIKEALLSPIPVEISKYDDKVSSFKSFYNEDQTQLRQQKHEAENGTVLTKNKTSPRQNLMSPQISKPSSIPVKIDAFRSVKKKSDNQKKSPRLMDENLKK